MKKLFLLLMTFLLSIPLWAGEQTVIINRNEGQFEEGNGVYYCTKGGIMMTFTSGLNNPNYLVEHQQVYFEVRSVNTEYIIKKIVFHCVDNTTHDNLDCFYWGPSTISIVQNWYNPSAPGSYTYSGYTGTWEGATNKIQFTTEAKPVRFGSVEITYEKEVGDVYDLVTSNDQLQAGQKYIIVNQYYSHGMSSFTNTTRGTMGQTSVSFVEGTNKHKVIVNDSIKIMTLQLSGNENRPWYLEGGNNTRMRRESSTSQVTDDVARTVGHALSFQTTSTDYAPVRIDIGDESFNYRALIRFVGNASTGNTDGTYAIGHSNAYKMFKTLDYNTSANASTYRNYQRVYLYMPARNYIITTECDPTAGGFITLGEGVLEIDGNQTSQQSQTVHFFVGTNEGYGVNNVTAVDSVGNPIELTCTSESALGNSYTFVMPASNVHIVATFADPYEIHTQCTPEYGGEFTFNSGAIDMNDKVISNEGKTVNFNVTASLGYVFTGLTCTDDATGNEITLTDNGDGTYSFIMPGNDVTLSATFDRVIGDIFDLVTSTSQIVDGNTYIIVSQYHDKVMKHWNRSETTFQGTPIVEWVNADKSRVRVDDNACFFRLDQDNTSGNPAGYLNTLVGYLGYSGYNGTTGNVVSTPDQSGYNHATMYISGSSDGERNFLCHFDSISVANRTIRYEAATNSFRIINYGNNTDERVWLYKLADSYHNISTVCLPPEGGNINVNTTSAQAGETVTFTVTPNQYYQFNDSVTVTYTDGTVGQIPVTNTDGTYSFTMPDGAVTITAVFEPEDLYLLGTALGKTWAPYGPKFKFDNGTQTYYIDVYFKGIRQGLNWTNGDDRYGYFSLTTRIADPNDQYGWDAISDYRIFPASNDEVIVQGESHNVYRNYSDYAFKIAAGIYRINVNLEKTQVSVVKTPVSLTITPPSGPLAKDTQVTWTSDVDSLVQAVAGLYPDVTEPEASSDYNLNGTGKTYGTSVVIGQEGPNTLIADSWVGYIEASDTATYQVSGGLYLLGYHNGATEFQMYGTPMQYNSNTDTYSIKVYYKGIRQGREFTQGDMQKGYFHFSTVQDNAGYGYEYTSHYLTADQDDYPVTPYVGDEAPTMHHLNSGTGLTSAFEIEPGIYTIYVSGDKTQMWVEKHPVSVTLTPAGGKSTVQAIYVPYGTVVTATSNLEDEVQTINQQEEAAFYFDKRVQGYGNQSFITTVEGDTITVCSPEYTQGIGHAYIGWIEVTDRGWYRYTPLNYLEENGVAKIERYQVVCDTLVGVWAARGYLWCKDIGNKSIDAKYPKMIPGTESMQRDYNVEFNLQDGEWDQSNWVVIDLGEYLDLQYGLDPWADEDLEAIDEVMSQLVNKQFEPLSVTGYYTFEDGVYKIYMDTLPKVLADTVGYPGFLRDPHEELTGVVYCYNNYTPGNFLYYAFQNGQTPGEAASAADKSDPKNNFFFVNPKIGEVAHVWGVWKGDDQFVVYQKSSTTNRYDLNGKYRVATWDYNRLDKNSETVIRYGNPNENGEGAEALIVNYDYDFHVAIIDVEEIDPILMRAPKQAPSETAMGVAKDYTFTDGDNSERYMILPLDLMGHGSTVTGVQEVAGDREVKSISFYNVMGQESDKPFDGINIVVTSYTDGTTQVTKVLM